MLIIDSPSESPYFNIAAEEYLLKETERDYAFFYVNSPSIIVGKHQNAWAEINLPWVNRKRIPVVRRISGGGTVWHDRGNLNFSFILNGEEGKLVNFREYAAPVLDYLRGMGLPAEFGQRNEMLIDGLKISGNAEHVFRKRVLHHGTLLFSADLSNLENALDTDPDEYEDKAVESVPSKTGNIADFLEESTEMKEFRSGLLGHIQDHFSGSERCMLVNSEISRIEELVAEKYSLWKWNIGYSPKYSLSRSFELEGKLVRTRIRVEKGKIVECRIQGAPEILKDFSESLTGLDHDPDVLGKFLSENQPGYGKFILENGLF